MTANADSSLLYVSEGGAIAFIDADAQSSYDAPIKLVPVGKMGVGSSGLLLDPITEDLLYVAGGRMGLWVMDADPGPSPPLGNRAARVDDSGNLNPSTQHSRRWCNDVGVFKLRVNGAVVDYLVALFSKTNFTRLRVYELEEVRKVLLDYPGVETGHEITPIHDVHLNKSDAIVWPVGPAPSPPRPYSFGYGLAVDNPTELQADVYVALGMHGILRVSFLPDQFGSSPTLPPPVKDDGPIFGDLSDYAGVDDLYGDLDYNENPGPVTFWHEPPFFVDVEIQNFNGGHFLYAAVDHLGWLRFDLEDTWSPNMPIDHHEGVRFAVLGGQELVSLVDGTGGEDPPFTYVRKIEVIDKAGDTVVVVTTNHRPVRMALDTINEGYSLDFIGGYPKPLLGDWPASYAGGGPHTLLYNINSGFTLHSTPIETQSTAEINSGGCTLYAAPAQSTSAVVFFAGESMPNLQGQGLGSFTTFRGTAPSPPQIETLVRDKAHRAGRNNHHAGVFRSSPNQSLLLTGFNDGGFYQDGALYICNNNEIRNYYFDPVNEPNDLLCSVAIIPNTDAQWLDSTNVWAWGSTKHPDPPRDTLYTMTEFDLGQDLCLLPGGGTPPSIVRQAYLDTILDRFNAEPRGHYGAGTVDAGYDAFIEAQPGMSGFRYLFASRFGSSDGVVMFRRDLLQARADNLVPSIGETIKDPFLAAAHVLDIETHPEYANVPDASDDDEAKQFLSQVDAKGWTGTWAPKLFERDVDTWWLAVPCNTVSLDPEHPIFNDPNNPSGSWPDGSGGYHPGWAPAQVFQDNYTAAMTRIFDVSDPLVPIALATLLGPGLATTTSDLEVLKVGSNYYLFAVGYVDGVSVWDITNLSAPETVYTSSDSVYFAYWKPPKSVSDLEDGSVFDLVIDMVDEDEIWVYASVLRGGVQVLQFLPNEPVFEDRLEPTGKLIETAARTSGLTLRIDDAGEKTLIVSDLGAGIRIYGKP